LEKKSFTKIDEEGKMPSDSEVSVRICRLLNGRAQFRCVILELAELKKERNANGFGGGGFAFVILREPGDVPGNN